MGSRRRQRRTAATPPAAATAAAAVSRWIWWALLGTAVVAAVLVYLQGLHGPFVYDDQRTIVDNPSLRDLRRLGTVLLWERFRPVVNLSYAVDFALWGAEPVGFHVTSLLLHLACVGVLFLLARLIVSENSADRVGRTETQLPLAAGAVAASLLAVHPLMSEAVVYASARSELLCGLFTGLSFLALRAFLLGRGRRFLAGGLGAFVLALGCKESAAVLPVLLLGWDLWLNRNGAGSFRRRLLCFHLPLLATVTVAAAGRLAIFLFVQKGAGIEGLWQNALVEAPVVWRYLGLLLVPAGQSLVHDVRPASGPVDSWGLAALIALGALVVVLALARGRLPAVTLGGAWFLAVLAPSHVIPLQEAMAEHRTYLASWGVFMIAGLATAKPLERWRRWSAMAMLLPVALLLVLAALTLARVRVWSEAVTLWADAARQAPRTWAPQYALGDALRAEGRLNEAVAAYRRAIEILPGLVDAHLNLGVCLAQLGRYDEARTAFNSALAIAPASAKPYTNLASLALLEKRPVAAREMLEEAIRRDPATVRARLMLAHLYENRFGDPVRALALCREVLAIEPSNRDAGTCTRRLAEAASRGTLRK